jgi:hypothetical protein
MKFQEVVFTYNFESISEGECEPGTLLNVKCYDCSKLLTFIHLTPSVLQVLYLFNEEENLRTSNCMFFE